MEMTMQTGQSDLPTDPRDTPVFGRIAWLGLAALVLLFGLGTIMVTATTIAEGFAEHNQASWTAVSGSVDECYPQQTSTNGGHGFNITCHLRYSVGSQEHVLNVYSPTVPFPDVLQYPPNQAQPFYDWINTHPKGTAIPLRYDPSNHAKAVMAGDFMPRGGPRTPNNVKLLAFAASGFLVLLGIARLTFPGAAPTGAKTPPARYQTNTNG
jgi:Protein of unknown function (DUF3592)